MESVKSIGTPQRKPSAEEVETENGAVDAFDPSRAIVPYVAFGWFTVTPGVDVVSVAVTPVAIAQPTLATLTATLTHSSRLIAPLLLAPLSSIVDDAKVSFGDPVRQKLRDAVPFAATVTLCDADGAQRRNGADAETV